MEAGALPEHLVLAHRLVGYATAFAIAPIALSAFARPSRHVPWAKAYLCVMAALYGSGLYFTFLRHEPGTFDWARNLAFNFFGFFFLLLGWRAIWRFRRKALAPAALDHAMRAVLIFASAALGAYHHFPSLVLGCLGLWLALAVFREIPEARHLYVTHQRCMLASFFYVMTVLSIVHVRAAVNLKWLWPALVGTLLAAYATRGTDARGRTRVAVRLSLAVALFMGAYVLFLSPGITPQ